MKYTDHIVRSCALRSATLALLLSVTTVRAANAQPHLVLAGGSGLPGDVVQLVIQLDGDAAGAAVSADVDIDFPNDLVAFEAPVNENCRVAPRLQPTHQIGGQLPRPGLLRLALFARGLDIEPLGDGELVTCDFQILEHAAPAVAPLRLEYVALGDHRGSLMDVAGVDGGIAIGDSAALPDETPSQCLSGCSPPPTATPQPTAGRCAADCNQDGTVSVDELVSSIRIALGGMPLEACSASDSDKDSAVSIGDLIHGVSGVLDGCPP